MPNVCRIILGKMWAIHEISQSHTINIATQQMYLLVLPSFFDHLVRIKCVAQAVADIVYRNDREEDH